MPSFDSSPKLAKNFGRLATVTVMASLRKMKPRRMLRSLIYARNESERQSESGRRSSQKMRVMREALAKCKSDDLSAACIQYRDVIPSTFRISPKNLSDRCRIRAAFLRARTLLDIKSALTISSPRKF